MILTSVQPTIVEKSSSTAVNGDVFRNNLGPTFVRRQHDDFLRPDALRNHWFR